MGHIEKFRYKSFNPIEHPMDDIPFDQIAKFKRDQATAAKVIAANVDNRDELCDFLEMIGLEIKPEARL